MTVTRRELAAMLRAARTVTVAREAAYSQRFACAALAAACVATAVFSEQIVGFPHGTGVRAFLFARAGSVLPAPQQDQWSQEESRMRSLQSMAVVAASSFAVASGAMAQTAVQWPVSEGGNGHWYAETSEVLVYPQLRAACEAKGGHLATLTTQAEWAWLKTNLPVAGKFIGGYQDHSDPNYSEPNGGWHWVTGEPFVLDLAYMGSTVVFGKMTVPGFDDCPAGTVGYCGCGPDGAQDALFITGCCNNIIDDVADGIVQNCDSIGRSGIIEWSADCNNDGIVDYGQILDGTLADANQNNIPDCCDGGANCPGPAIQWRVQDGGNGHWYRRLGEFRNWPSAKARCEQLGGHLASLTSAAEWSWAINATGITEGYVGAFQDHSAPTYSEPYGGWRWVTGEPFTFSGTYMMGFDDCPGAAPPSCACGAGAQDALFIMGCCGHMLNDSQDGTPADCDMGVNLPYPPVDSLIEWSADCNNDGIVDYGQILEGTLADANHNNIPDCCENGGSCDPCRADVDQSGAVNGVDLAAVLNNWGTAGGKQPRSDINHDGIVNGSDLAEVLNAWGPCH